MLVSLARNWWILLLSGLCAILFGVSAMVWPGLALDTLIILFGVYCIADGLASLMASFTKDERGQNWQVMLLGGVLSILSGLAAVLYPGVTALILLIMMGVWAILRGILEIIAAIQLRKVLKHEWLLGIAGALSILFGIAIVARPNLGALAIVWLIGSLAIAKGLLFTILALRLWGLDKKYQTALRVLEAKHKASKASAM
jgi:uncharacterized membrane protein HdeD (DUF308 family)